MKNYSLSWIRYALLSAFCSLLLFACEDDSTEEAVSPSATAELDYLVSDQIKSQFADLGFDVSDLAKQGNNYLVEGDMVVTPKALQQMLSSEPTVVNNPEGEQYRTFNLVSRNLRTIRIRPTSSQSRFLLAIDRAIYNYNQLGLTFQMVRVGSNDPAEITVRLSSGNGFLGRAGFPTGNGLPWNDIVIDVAAFNGKSDDDAELTMTHEIGHCLGLRHSDWYDRSYSCGGGGSEGNPNSAPGAVGIPGTVQTDPASIMNSCGTRRPLGRVTGEFSRFDIVALQTLY